MEGIERRLDRAGTCVSIAQHVALCIMAAYVAPKMGA